MAGTLSNGHIGVYIFFAISGFILALPFGKSTLVEKKISLKTYYLRRLTRLELPYLICMTALFLAFVALKHGAFSGLFPHFLASLVYMHRIIYDTWSPINPPAWTLEVEVQFYLIAPFLAMAYFRIPSVARRSILLIVIFVKILLTNLTPWLDPFTLSLPYLFEFFLVGLLIADIFLTEWKSQPIRKKFYDLLTIFSVVILFSTWTWDKNLEWKFIFIGSLFLTVYGAMRSVHVNNFLKNPWITGLGGMCYSIYLLHLGLIEFFIMIYKHFLPSEAYWINYWIGLVLFIPILLLICIPFFLLVEKPCMDSEWPRKLAQKFKFKNSKA